MKNIEIIESFKNKKVLVVGDVMIDSYIIGNVERISPEAPVQVVNVKQKENRLGGAANVVLNIQSLGATPIICSVIGKDDEGNILLKEFEDRKLSNKGIIQSDSRKTTVKTRVIGNKHQLLRIDYEQTNDLNDDENTDLINKFSELINDCDVVILEDYNKGVLNKNNIKTLINIANQNNKPIAVDPKKNNFFEYQNVTLFKPNLKELKDGLDIEIDVLNINSIDNASNKLMEIICNKISFITLSEHGVYIATQNEKHKLEAHLRNISDVSGAGDTVISVASLCLASDCNIKQLAFISNLAGGLVCEEAGVVPINLEKLKQEIEINNF